MYKEDPICVFRVDASVLIGMGHLMRCLNLAEILYRNGFKIHFVLRDMGVPEKLLDNENFTFHLLSKPKGDIFFKQNDYSTWLQVDLEQEIYEIKKYLNTLNSKCEWLIVDHYGLDIIWEKNLKTHCHKLLVIDDLANRQHECDILLDQNFFLNGMNRYKNLIPSDSIFLLGCNYTLLNDKYRVLCGQAKIRNQISTVLINFGGADLHNETLKALLGVLKNQNINPLTIYVVVGEICPHKEEIKKICQVNEKCFLYCQTSKLNELIMSADLAVGSGGMALWERMALGLPSIATSIADNQQKILEDLSKAGFIKYLGGFKSTTSEKYTDILDYYLNNLEELSQMSKLCIGLVDGRGCERVLHQMNILSCLKKIYLKLAVPEDMMMIYDWRNNEQVRKWSLSSDIIDISAHQRWYLQALNNNDCKILLSFYKNKAIGVLRLDTKNSDVELSLYLSPEFIGKGLGFSVVSSGIVWVKKNRPQVKNIIAKILSGNIPSQKIFIKAGFLKCTTFFSKEKKAGFIYKYKLGDY